MKKNIIYTTIIGLALSLSLASCNLDTSPTTQVDEELILDDVQHLDKVITGAWVYTMETFNSYANPGYGSFLRAGDAMGSDVVLNTRYGFATHYTFSAMYGKGGTGTLSWNISYKVINNMNIVLRNIDSASGSASEKTRVKAQALALRGFMYLHLASHYSFAIDKDPNGVATPIYTELDPANEGKAAASVSEVYAQSIADLEKALELLPSEYDRAEKWQINKTVILGLLSRSTLYARQWDKAAQYSDDLLAINNYLMNEKEYAAGFNDLANPEWIWGQPQRLDQNNASYQFNYLDVTSSGSYYYSFNMDPYFADKFDSGDYRKKLIYWAPDPGKDPASEDFVWMRYAKFKFKQDQIADIVLMRTSEIYLINAEAKARLNDSDAQTKLNALKTARGAQTVSLAGQSLLDEIWLERRKELFAEGFSLVDIIRNQQIVERKDYPQSPTVEYTYVDDKGVSQTKSYKPRGHRILNFPDKEKSPFVANSKYYLFRIPDTEERSNTLLYSKYPRLSVFN